MKSRVTFRCIVPFVAAAACLVAQAQPAASQPTSLDGLTMLVRPDKRIYTLGEPVHLAVRLVNTSPRAIVIPAEADVWTGHVEVFIASQPGEYARCTGPGWGLRDLLAEEARILQPGDSWTTQATILYNHGVRTDHLAPAARAEMRGRLLNSGFAFRSPGVYYIKVAVYGFNFADALQSADVQVAMTEPQGVDRDVWNALNARPELAYFLHTGGPHGHPHSDESVALVETLERLAATDPSSRYAEAIRARIAAHEKAVEELVEGGVIPR